MQSLRTGKLIAIRQRLAGDASVSAHYRLGVGVSSHNLATVCARSSSSKSSKSYESCS